MMTEEGEKEPLLITTDRLDPEEAETSNIEHLDSISREGTNRNRNPRNDVNQNMMMGSPFHDIPSIFAPGPSIFKTAARRVVLMQKLQSQRSRRRSKDLPTSPKGTHHVKNRGSVAAADLLDQIQVDNEAVRGHDDTTAILHSAGISVSSSSSDNDNSQDEEDQVETLPVVYGTMSTDQPQQGKPRSRPSAFSAATWKRRFGRCCINSNAVITRTLTVLAKSYLLLVAVPLFLLAIVLYYGVGNPPWNFVPGSAHSAWMVNFVGRQVVTFELARLAQWLLLDCLMLGSRIMSQWLGPIMTMTAVQSRGWPFLVTAWAGWDMLILYGNGPFQSHWLYWTDIELYTIANSGQYILSSEVYLRILICMIVAGMVATAKRMFFTIQFGRRMLGAFLQSIVSSIVNEFAYVFLHRSVYGMTDDFKPRLETLLADMVLVSEIADVAVEAENLSIESLQGEDINSGKGLHLTVHKSAPKAAMWSSVSYEKIEDEETDVPATPKQTTNQTEKGRPILRRSASGSFLFKTRLDKWIEPKTKKDKVRGAGTCMVRRHRCGSKSSSLFCLFFFISRTAAHLYRMSSSSSTP
jgi:hypothetical protein